MTIGELVGYVTLDTRPWMRGLRDVDKSIAANKARMGQAAMGFAAYATAIAVALGKAVKEAADFEAEMRNVNTIMMASEHALRDYSEQVLTMSIAVGRMPTDLARGFYDVASASFYGAEGLHVLNVSSRAAVAGLTDTKTAAKAVVSVLNAYGRSAVDAEDVADTLFMTVRRGVITFEELAHGIGRVASTAKIAGVEFDEIGAAMATITRAGQSSEEAFTALNRLLLAYIKTTDRARKAGQEFGIELSAAALRSKGLLGAVQELVEELGVTETEMDRIIDSTSSNAEAMELLAQKSGKSAEALAELFPNIRALRALLPLMRDEGREFAKDMEFMGEKAKSMAEAFAEQTKTLRQRWNQTKAAFSAAAISIGQTLLPVLKAVADVLKGIAIIFKGIPQPIKGVLGVLMALSAAFFALNFVLVQYKRHVRDVLIAQKSLIRSMGASTFAASKLKGALALLAIVVVTLLISAYSQAEEKAEDLELRLYALNKRAEETGTTIWGLQEPTKAWFKTTLVLSNLMQTLGLRALGSVRAYESHLEQMEQAVENRAMAIEEQVRREEELAALEEDRARTTREAHDELMAMMFEIEGNDAFVKLQGQIFEMHREFDRMKAALAGGPDALRELMDAAGRGAPAAMEKLRGIEAELNEWRAMAQHKHMMDYQRGVEEAAKRERETRLSEWEKFERERIGLAESWAEYLYHVGTETFDKYMARLRGVIAQMRRVDEERAAIGAEPIFTQEVMTKEMAYYDAHMARQRELRGEAGRLDGEREAAAQRLVAALRSQEEALSDVFTKQRNLVEHLLEMGDITEEQWSGHVRNIVKLMRQADRERRRYGQEPMFREQVWQAYAELHRKQTTWMEQIRGLEEDRFRGEKEHVDKLIELRRQLADAEISIRDRGFRRRQAQIKMEYTDRESEEAALAEVQRKHAESIISDIAKGQLAATDVQQRMQQLDDAVRILEALGERGEDVDKSLREAYTLIDKAADEQRRVKEQAVRDEEAAWDAREEALDAETDRLKAQIETAGDVLDTRIKGSARLFFDEMAGRVRDLGRVWMTEMGKVAIPAGPATRGGVAGGVVINLGAGGAGGGAGERDIIRRVRDALTAELQRARS